MLYAKQIALLALPITNMKHQLYHPPHNQRISHTQPDVVPTQRCNYTHDKVPENIN